MKFILFVLFVFNNQACKKVDSTTKLLENILSTELVSDQLHIIKNDMDLEFVDVLNILPEGAVLMFDNTEIIVERDSRILKKIDRYDFVRENKRLILITQKILSESEFYIYIYHPNSGMIVTNKIRQKGKSYEIIDQEIGDL